MTANDVREHLKSLDGGWVDWDNTVDTFKIGDPDVELTGIAVGWMSYTESLRRAHDLGCNLFVCHEPTFYNHHDTDEKVFLHAGVRAKRDWLEESGMVVLRCHDLWDQVLDIGIPDSWGQFLGLGDFGQGFLNRGVGVVDRLPVVAARLVFRIRQGDIALARCRPTVRDLPFELAQFLLEYRDTVGQILAVRFGDAGARGPV